MSTKDLKKQEWGRVPHKIRQVSLYDCQKDLPKNFNKHMIDKQGRTLAR